MNTRTLHPARVLAEGTRRAVRTALNRMSPGASRVPSKPADITPAWLATALGRPEEAIQGINVLDSHSGTAARARIGVAADDDSIPGHLFVKLPPSNYLQHVLLDLFGLDEKEVLAYRALGEHPPVRIPRCHAAESDARRSRFVLVLEDLTATARFRTVVDTVSRAEAEAVVDAMADLHSAFWNSDRFAGDLAPLAYRPAIESHLGALIRRRLLRNIKGHTAGLIPDAVKLACRIFYLRGAEIDSYWAGLPRTLLHGDPHLGNLFFENDVPGFLDWQIASAGAGIRDVAYFLTSSVDPALLRRIERALVQRYVDRLAAAGIRVDGAQMWTLYRAGATDWFLAAVCTAEAGARMQPLEVSRVGVRRAVEAVEAHDSFRVLTALIDGR
ncbi:phosphotransferase family protein [Nocardia sp. NPDC055053]